jgi:hypothetical protein
MPGTIRQGLSNTWHAPITSERGTISPLSATTCLPEVLLTLSLKSMYVSGKDEQVLRMVPRRGMLCKPRQDGKQAERFIGSIVVLGVPLITVSMASYIHNVYTHAAMASTPICMIPVLLGRIAFGGH